MNPPTATSLIACSREAGAGCPYCASEIAVGNPIMVCQSCGSVHHRVCWKRFDRCGSYSCAPARRELPSSPDSVLSISAAELDRATPLPSHRPRAFVPIVPGASTEASGPRNRLAVASLVTALAGIPLFGVVTGLVAIVLGALALGSIRNSNQKGLVMALAGLLLGLVDMVAWLFFLSTYFAHSGGADLQFADSPPELSTTQGLSPQIRGAMQANVLIEHRTGLFASAMGSGVILEIAQGEALIVTNRHVIDPGFPESGRSDGAPETLGKLEVKMIGQPVSSGRVVWIAPGGIDLALVRVACAASGKARAAKWQVGRASNVGEAVFAIGNPQRLGWTHTQGAISQYRVQQIGSRRVQLIQTQAAINPGNSGGGLYDRDGYLLGINTWTGDKRVSEGISFAIALDSLLDLAPPGLGSPHLGEIKRP